jgi:hypothetical protein
MEHNNHSHDNTDIRVNTKINVYGNVVFVGSISVAGVGFLFLGIWMVANWQQAIILSAVFVYGIISLVGIALLALVAALWIRLVIVPGTSAFERAVEARGQDVRNQLIHVQENGIVLLVDGKLQVIPLFPQQKVIEASKQLEPHSDKSAVLELFRVGCSLRDIVDRTGVKYNQVQKWTSEEKQNGD